MMVKITIFTGKNCPRCPAAKQLAQEVAKKYKCEVEELDAKENLIIALQHQVISTPSIMVEDEVISRGEIPSKEKLIETIKRYL